MEVKEYNFNIGTSYGGLQFYPYQLAFGFSVRWGDFKALRFYFGPLKIWISFGVIIASKD